MKKNNSYKYLPKSQLLSGLPICLKNMDNRKKYMG
jgi:hypothetical protein